MLIKSGVEGVDVGIHLQEDGVGLEWIVFVVGRRFEGM